MDLPVHEVDVPIRNTAQPGLSGVHVFTGPADSRSTADGAPRRAAGRTRTPPSGKRPDRWNARSYRPDWELDWPATTVGRWNDPYSRVRAADNGDLEL
ncbi:MULTISPECIES: hypothetical protein [Streptomyces violaceusniger group]|nr:MULTISPECIES: hypothetical protein [Streptomyces violaceusniger group]